MTWIPVGERLPEPDEWVLGYIPAYADTDGFVVGYLSAHGYWEFSDENIYPSEGQVITHWQPLPEPPGKDGEA